MMKRRILAVALVTLAVLLPVSVRSESDSNTISKTPGQQERVATTVELTIDYGDGAQKRYPELPWKKAMTVLDALEWSDKHPRGIEVGRRGKGQTTLVTKIDDLKNSGSRGKNWVFRVNGKLADRGCGVFVLKPGDRVLWRFEQYK